ncbi:MAG: N-acetyltransferase [Saprospiraceae bacterium]|nr:N-acetyltransferase [Saprospiraceae bacterium]
MNQNLSYLKADSMHCASIAGIFNENIEHGGVTLWTKSFTASEIQSILENLLDRERVFVLALDENVIGWGSIRQYHPKEGYVRACETSVFLRRTHVNKGYGTSFKKFILSECKNLGYHHVHAKIIASNQISIAYNLKLGYTMVGIQKEIGYVKGKYCDVAIMQLLL